ncbi:hypothetical protein ABFX02_02G151500 [Erythranthe guttata]
MQGDRKVRDNSDTSNTPFDNFGFRGSVFDGRDPFDDPFFTRPRSSLFDSNIFSSISPGDIYHTTKSKGPVIEELDSDAEEEPGEKTDDAALRNRNPLVEHPDEHQSNECEKSISNGRDVLYSNDRKKVEVMQPLTKSVSFQRVTYGGINGAYYTASTSRRVGSDGVTLEESKQADKTTGEATHKISRGIHDKGHSVMRKLDSDGKVDTMQSLHNLEQDELEGFEQAWRGNADRQHLHGWNNTFDFPRGNFGNLQAQQNSGGRPKKVVRINIE